MPYIQINDVFGYYGEDSEPIDVSGSYNVEYVRDEAGHAIEEWYYDRDHQLVDNASGMCI